jgi:hypothetical protein
MVSRLRDFTSEESSQPPGTHLAAAPFGVFSFKEQQRTLKTAVTVH